ncbi:MAG: glycosyltransferase, partial [Candidatus Colwellbacteria bacterium]|nr:glycosyltransferase [Candidatus Colwellbacteria bacterium]
MRKFRVLMTGGGTGGHIYPLVAIAAELQVLSVEMGASLKLHYLGSYGPYRELLEANDILVRRVAGSKLRRYFSFANF